MILRTSLLAALMALSSCAPTGIVPETTRAATTAPAPDLPPARRFQGTPDLGEPTYGNAQLARDFMALSFQLETGRALPVFTRFEGPVTIAVEGAAPASLDADLDALIARLRREARIDIQRARSGEMGSITVTALPRAQLQRYVPGAACFVVPRVAGWKDYLSKRLGPATDWTTLRTRERATVVLPSDVSAQEIRDCLHEEVAQALGPLNDLHRLPFSVFNDDNVHVVLTRFDMAILRATYDPGLVSGLSQQQVAEALPAILARTNPRGRRRDEGAVVESDGAWKAAIAAAVSPAGSDRARLQQARRAVGLSQRAGHGDERLGFAQLSRGRAALPVDADEAITSFVDAAATYKKLRGDGIHSAQVALQLGAFAVSAGRAEAATRILDRAIPAARGAQNASLLATLLLLRAEATELQGATAEARRIRREAQGWGRYAWGDRVLALRMAEVATLGPGA